MAVIKNLTETRNEYLKVISNTNKIIKRAKKNGMDKKQLAEIYGIYYNAIAGLIRSGAMYKKDIDTDGSAVLYIMTREEEIKCPDAPIKNIFKEDYDDIVIPYEDNASPFMESYSGKGRRKTDVDYSEDDGFALIESGDEELLDAEEVTKSSKKKKKRESVNDIKVEDEDVSDLIEEDDDDLIVVEDTDDDIDMDNEEDDIIESKPKAPTPSIEPVEYDDEDMNYILASIKGVKRKCALHSLCVVAATLAIAVSLMLM